MAILELYAVRVSYRDSNAYRCSKVFHATGADYHEAVAKIEALGLRDVKIWSVQHMGKYVDG